jgi:methylmalonyl-CoA/ethylmalonyl-CoA epimerase
VIRKIDHLGIAVRSIAEGRVFYEALGLAVAAVAEVPQEGVRVAMIPCGDIVIELLEPTSEESPVARFLAKRGPGLHHLCLQSDALAADDARLRRSGIALLRPTPTRGAGGCWVQFVDPRAAGGVLVELLQPDGEGEGAGGHEAAGGHGEGAGGHEAAGGHGKGAGHEVAGRHQDGAGHAGAKGHPEGETP